MFTTLGRIAAWILLLVFLLYFISGYGMTKGLISYELASNLHLHWLVTIGFIAFVIHTFWAVHLAFKRWRIWNTFSKCVLMIIYLLLVIGFVYVQYFYDIPKSSPSTQVKTEQSSQVVTHVFTKEELSVYNGKNGQPAYVAVDGSVYDVSSVYRNGSHHGSEAGTDVSVGFHNQHLSQMLEGFKVVGTYAG